MKRSTRGQGERANSVWTSSPDERWFRADGAGESGSRTGTSVPALATLARDEGLLTQEQVREAVDEGLRSGERLGEVLIRLGWLDERQLACLIARQRGFRYVDAVDLPDEPVTPAVLPLEQARVVGAFGVGFEDGRPLVALADPSEDRLGQVRAIVGDTFTPVVVTKSTLEWLLAREGVDDGGSGSALALVEGGAASSPPASGETAPEATGGSYDQATETGHAMNEGDASGELLEQLEHADALLATLRLRFEQLQQRDEATRRRLAECEREVERLQGELIERDARLRQLKTALSELSTGI